MKKDFETELREEIERLTKLIDAGIKRRDHYRAEGARHLASETTARILKTQRLRVALKKALEAYKRGSR